MQAFDEFVVNWAQNLHGGFLDTLMTIVTYIGYGWFVIPIIYFLARRRWSAAIMAVSALALGFLCGNVFLKNIVGRPRPFAEMGFDIIISPPHDAFSFPSCHALHSFAAATVLAYQTRKTMPGVAWAGFALATAIAFSRLYLGVHYLTDIVAGAAIGVIVAIVCIYTVNAFSRKYPGQGNKA